MKFRKYINLGLLVGLQFVAFSGMAEKSDTVQESDLMHRDTLEASIFRGDLVYANYCTLCHGREADGKGRAARLYNPKPANLVQSDKNDAYFELILRQGGAKLGRSEFMPAWQEELTEEQIKDVVAYLRSINQVNN